MSARPTSTEWGSLCVEIGRVVELLAEKGPGLLEMDDGYGYPQSSRPEATARGGHGDPTGARAVAPDPVHVAVSDLLAHMAELRGHARQTIAALNRGLAMAPDPRDARPDSTQVIPQCVNRYCDADAAINLHTGRTTRDGRCMACYSWRRRYGADAGPATMARRAASEAEGSGSEVAA